MSGRPNIFERAYQMAAAGAPTDTIIRQLDREGYEYAHASLSGKSVRDKIKRLRVEGRKHTAAGAE